MFFTCFGERCGRSFEDSKAMLWALPVSSGGTRGARAFLWLWIDSLAWLLYIDILIDILAA